MVDQVKPLASQELIERPSHITDLPVEKSQSQEVDAAKLQQTLEQLTQVIERLQTRLDAEQANKPPTATPNAPFQQLFQGLDLSKPCMLIGIDSSQHPGLDAQTLVERTLSALQDMGTTGARWGLNTGKFAAPIAGEAAQALNHVVVMPAIDGAVSGIPIHIIIDPLVNPLFSIAGNSVGFTIGALPGVAAGVTKEMVVHGVHDFHDIAWPLLEPKLKHARHEFAELAKKLAERGLFAVTYIPKHIAAEFKHPDQKPSHKRKRKANGDPHKSPTAKHHKPHHGHKHKKPKHEAPSANDVENITAAELVKTLRR